MRRAEGQPGRLLQTLWLVAAWAAACTQHYAPPEVPEAELAYVKIDERAKVLTVDGLPPTLDFTTTGFPVGAGCRELTVTYEESYSTLHGVTKDYPSTVELVERLGRLEDHSYATNKPIRFFVPAKAGMTYWVTSSFNGAEFFPRVSELNRRTDEAERTIAPDVRCP